MRVIQFQFPIYIFLDLFTDKEKESHVSDMKPFARRDHMECIIGRNFDDRGNNKKRTTLEFHVSWLDYAQESNTWEPYENLRNFEPVHTYLAKKNLLKLVPPKYREATHVQKAI